MRIITFKADEHIIKQLNELETRLEVNRSEVIRMAIQNLYTQVVIEAKKLGKKPIVVKHIVLD